MVTIAEIETALGTYSLQEIFELNDVEEADVLYFLIEEGFVTLPKVRPL